ncbi:MAG: hypothetical protein CMJ36_05715 [Phycisphaerae bacterium]|nr:hypothetical protein [Phycisphaerae bacterium]
MGRMSKGTIEPPTMFFAYNRRMRFLKATPTCSIAMLLAMCCASCSSIERARPRPSTVSTVTKLDDPGETSIMRGTVGAETIMLGYSDSSSPAHQPIVVRGYGLVVDLNGTGSSDIPPAVRAHMVDIMDRQGVGQISYNAGGITPEQLLNSPDTAVVIVEGVIPPASVGRLTPPSIAGRTSDGIPGTIFDLRVFADPNTGTTSLEGGRLYTTDLRPGPIVVGSRQATILAKGKGSIFINPFTNPNGQSSASVNQLTGRILNGGEVMEDMPLKLMLMEPSHTRVRIIQDAVNRRFPQESGQLDPTAKGASDSIIELNVPPSMRNDTENFVQLVMHVTLRQANAESVALSTQKLLLSDVENASTAYWRWCAIGDRSLPLVRELYDDPEEQPRLAALRTGAFLGDPIVGKHLRQLGTDGDLGQRLEAAELMKSLPQDPRTDRTLREMLNDEDVEVRLRAYEALAERNDPLMKRTSVGGKFMLDQVDSKYPMVYISQSKMPRIAIFGEALTIEQPITMGAWENRLLIQDSRDSDDKIEVRYRPARGGGARILEADITVGEFIESLAHRPDSDDPRPGLNLTYSETVGAIHAVWNQGYLASDFKAEQDRLLAQIRRYGTLSSRTERPEFEPDADETGEQESLDASAIQDSRTVTPLRKSGKPVTSP